MDKIKILMISATSVIGGGPNHIRLLGDKISKNFEVYYAMPENKNFSNQNNKAKFINISERKISLFDIYSICRFINLNSIDILHAHGKGASVLGRLVKLFINKPLVYTFHGVHIKCHNIFIKYFYFLFEFLTGWIDDCKIFVSRSENYYAINSRLKLGKKTIIINNGVANHREFLSKNKNKLSSLDYSSKGNNNFKVISVCRFVKQKNLFEILKIANKLKNIDFIIIGDGPLKKDLELNKKINKLENIHFIGFKKNVLPFLKNSDLYLSTSLYEGLPISILEAMSVGLPIIASNVVGNCDTIVHGESGYLYPIGEVDMAVKFIERLLIDNLKRIEFGESALKRQQEFFSLKNMIFKHENLYRKIYYRRLNTI